VGGEKGKLTIGTMQYLSFAHFGQNKRLSIGLRKRSSDYWYKAIFQLLSILVKTNDSAVG